ncbi:MAG: C-terminal binding protein [Dehalococcoidia bacterium]|jgi:D-3-phosphoglycerate dehydrogenase|nr:C-terminal binding protein [Dehalococcoidia bacterium]|tara:strand:+ start:5878 stop:6864 length:987 start_codon:yes stop_codon:yes gene_type:complete
MTTKALITDYVWPSTDPEREVLEAAGIELVIAPDSSESTLTELARDVDAIMFCFAQVTDKVLESATNCKIAARYGIGVDNVDIAKATELGIVVTNVPDYCMDEVTDHALGMILALNRRLVPHTSTVVGGGWNDVVLNQPMHRTRGATLGIVGFGRIGRSLAAKAVGFGMNILTYDPLLDAGSDVDAASAVTLDELLKQSDFVSLHAPLIPATENMISTSELAKMKSGSIIVNCSRGGLIDEDALAASLASGHIAGAGLDVVEPTPPEPSSVLLEQDNVIITPHTAFFSQASTLELERRTAQEAIRVLNGELPENLINPDVLGKARSGI